MARKVDWVIHAVVNGLPCHLCGKTPTRLLPNCCNAHTHGMEKYDHMDFQLVLNFPPHEIARILNTLGLRVQDGEQFTVYGICVKTTFGEVYCCEDVSCSEEDVRELVNRLKQAPFLFEELPYLVEDYISFLSEYTE